MFHGGGLFHEPLGKRKTEVHNHVRPGGQISILRALARTNRQTCKKETRLDIFAESFPILRHNQNSFAQSRKGAKMQSLVRIFFAPFAPLMRLTTGPGIAE